MEESKEKRIADTFSQNPINFYIDCQYSGFREFLCKLKLLPKKRYFKIKPATLGTLLAISPELSKIIIDIQENSFPVFVENVAKNVPAIVKTISLVIREGRKDKELEKFLIKSLKAPEFEKLLAVVIMQTNVAFFLKSLASMGRLNVMKENKISGEPSA